MECLYINIVDIFNYIQISIIILILFTDIYSTSG